jgi:RND family efflux transporter MFP subunit
MNLDGVVEALRQTTIAAQVQGSIIKLPVKAGDTVRAGQLLVSIDQRMAQQDFAARTAQMRAAAAGSEVAAREVERQRQLFAKHYISQAALDRAEAQYKATQAQTAAQLATVKAASTQTSYYVLTAPYPGIVTNVAVTLGDMAMPGSPLLTIFDPTALRVKTLAPESVATKLETNQVSIRLAGSDQTLSPVSIQWMPAADPSTHTRELRLRLPSGISDVRPGQFAQIQLPKSEVLTTASGISGQRLYVPKAAVLRHAELTAVYVVDSKGKPLLRQVRLGSPQGDLVEVLSGVSANESVALDPQVAARTR